MQKLLLLLFSLTSLVATPPITPTSLAQHPCAICWDSLSPQPPAVSLPIRTLPCHLSHTFHTACIQKWVAKAPHCPVCRKPYNRGCLETIAALFRKAQEGAKLCFSLIHELCSEYEKQLEAHNESFIS